MKNPGQISVEINIQNPTPGIEPCGHILRIRETADAQHIGVVNWGAVNWTGLRRSGGCQYGDAGNELLPGRQPNLLERQCDLMSTCHESFSQAQAPGEVPEGLAQFPRDQNARHGQA